MKDNIDLFYEESCRLNGCDIVEREHWNTLVSAQEIKKFSYGICDENPLWLDAEYAQSGPYGKQVAPPSFLLSVLYPMLHGAKIDTPMSNMASQLQIDWYLPVCIGDELRAKARQTSVKKGSDRHGRRLIYIDSETRYRNQNGHIVASATATVAWIENLNKSLLLDRQIHAYSEEEINRIKTVLHNYKRRGNKPIDPLALNVGDTLPEFISGPLTLGDISYWEAVTGPNYRPGAYTAKHHSNDKTATFKNPLTGWDVQKGQSHLDLHLARHKGVPAPYDYGIMRFAFLSAMLTDWIGDFGKLNHLKINFSGLVIYGDTTFYSGRIINKKILKNEVELTIKFLGRNQLNSQIASAESIVRIPIMSPSKTKAFTLQTKCHHKSKPLTHGFIHLFEQQVNRTPHAIAVKDSRSEISFLELNKRSNQLANMLTELGGESNTVIGILLNRDIEWIVALIAIWKCGAVYLPLDAHFSTEFSEFIIDDTSASILISTSTLVNPQICNGIKALLLDRDNIEIQQQSYEYQKQSVQSEDPAYLMHTSGSSGNSKTVYISNRALTEYLKILPKCLALEANDRYLATASFIFSASIRQLCYPLAYGSCLVIANEKEMKDPLRLASLIDKEKVTLWDTVPSVWLRSCERIFLNNKNSTRPALDSLKKIVLTGEPLTWEQVNHWYKNTKKNTRILNLYSQTETTGSVAGFSISPGQLPKKGTVPIGNPLPDTRFFLLDENLVPVKKGMAGEICVNNNRLATGYTGEKGLTSKHFTDFQGAPVYRTGDLARLKSHNCYEFIGRKDRRIKLRGFRIDLDEIESVLNKCRYVRESAVLVLKKAPNEQLAAYISSDNEKVFATDQLRDNLKQKLPDYMIPHLITAIDFLPRTQSGKIDRNALLVMDFSNIADHRSTAVSPQTSLEKILTEVWENVIKVQSVGIRDNFFDLGGDSLTAIQLLNEIEKKTGIQLPVDTLMNLSTIESMAALIDKNRKGPSSLNITKKKEYKNPKGFFDQKHPEHYKTNFTYSRHPTRYCVI